MVGVDGNAWSIMATFKKAAERQGWSKEEVTALLDKAMSGDYNHLLNTIQSHCK